MNTETSDGWGEIKFKLSLNIPSKLQTTSTNMTNACYRFQPFVILWFYCCTKERLRRLSRNFHNSRLKPCAPPPRYLDQIDLILAPQGACGYVPLAGSCQILPDHTAKCAARQDRALSHNSRASLRVHNNLTRSNIDSDTNDSSKTASIFIWKQKKIRIQINDTYAKNARMCWTISHSHSVETRQSSLPRRTQV